MSIARWADFSAGWPGAAALKGAGFAGVIAYIGLGSGSKRFTAEHYQDCVAQGLQVLCVAEYDTHDAEHGYATGVANAQLALDDARALGIPDTVGIACAADEHLTAAQIPTAVEYARGFRDVLGFARAGAYGFGEFVDAVHDAGLTSWYWRCGSAPTEPWMTFWQRNDGTVTTNGIQIDIDEQLNLLEGDMTLTPDQSAKIDAILEQLTGSPTLGQYPGYPSFVPGSTVKCTLVDFARNIDARTYTMAPQVSAVAGALPKVEADVLAAIKGVQAGTVDVAALATALNATLPAAVVADLGAKLAK